MASTKRITTTDELHPVVRAAVTATLAELQAAGHPFELFETYRTPQRQASLYAQGRTTKGPKVTNAPAWSSYHQYGLAADFVLFIAGTWSWDTSGTNKAHWAALHKTGRKNGLEPLSWELPHLQLAGTSAAELRKGNYPAIGDDAWAENLSDMIDDWTSGGAPPKPPVVSRPPLSSADSENDEQDSAVRQSDASSASDGEASDRGAEIVATGEGQTMATDIFSTIQAFIDKWEGGYVNHPSDPGGPTNMGITLATLAAWRGHPVSVDDVKNLTREEQRRIMKAKYFDIINGDQLPPAVAAVAYNAAILHGPRRASEFLQTSLNKLGAGLKVDGVIGQKTIGAVGLGQPSSLAADYIMIEFAYLRSLKTWPTFGTGWSNRLNDMKAFADRLARNTSPIAPDPSVQELDRPVNGVLNPPVPPAPNAVGPIGGILGQPIGRVLDGRKTNLGIAGLLLSAVPSVLEATSTVALPAGLTQFQPLLLALSTAMTAWGALAKLEKEVKKETPLS